VLVERLAPVEPTRMWAGETNTLTNAHKDNSESTRSMRGNVPRVTGCSEAET